MLVLVFQLGKRINWSFSLIKNFPYHILKISLMNFGITYQIYYRIACWFIHIRICMCVRILIFNIFLSLFHTLIGLWIFYFSLETKIAITKNTFDSTIDIK